MRILYNVHCHASAWTAFLWILHSNITRNVPTPLYKVTLSYMVFCQTFHPLRYYLKLKFVGCTFCVCCHVVCKIKWCDVIRYGTVRYNAKQCNAMQYDARYELVASAFIFRCNRHLHTLFCMHNQNKSNLMLYTYWFNEYSFQSTIYTCNLHNTCDQMSDCWKVSWNNGGVLLM